MSGEPSLMLAQLSKPETGEPCNGCGVCCLAMPCAISMDAFGTKPGERCPVLEWRDGRFWCGAVEMDETGFVAWRLGVGKGCCSGDPIHEDIARRMNAHHRAMVAERTPERSARLQDSSPVGVSQQNETT